VAFFAWHHTIFRVALAKQARGTGHCHTVVQRIAMHERFPRHDIATRAIAMRAIATRRVLPIATRVVLAIATRGVL